jgi:hypothetical protein
MRNFLEGVFRAAFTRRYIATLIVISSLLAALRAWEGRWQMQGDGLSYLEIAS